MVAYRSADWKDGSESELSEEEKTKLAIALAISFGFTALLVATVYLVSITLGAFEKGTFIGLPANIY